MDGAGKFVQQEKENTEDLTYSRLFQHSPVRGNLLSWYPIADKATVLLVAESCTAIETWLQEKKCRVVAVAPDAYCGTEQKYDVIVHIGVIDCGTKTPETAWTKRLKQYRAELKEGGLLLLAVPNRLGLKYFAGCADEVYDTYFAGPQGYAADMTRQALARGEYGKVLHTAGFKENSYYYPYPDYLFPSVIYSEKYLPGQGELNDNIRNFDKDRYVLFDEMRVYNSLLKEGIFEEFTNSFLIAACADMQEKTDGEQVVYSKFSMERAPQFQIRTDIIEKADGSRVVRKCPLTKEAENHVRRMEENYHKLQKAAEGTNISFCPVSCHGQAAESPWVKGEVLQTKLQRLLENGEKEAASRLIYQYIEVTKQLLTADMLDVDLIFPNILVDGDTWNIIDYEWTFTEKIPGKWILYRAMFYLAVQLPGYEQTRLDALLKLAGITDDEAAQFENWEVDFQEYLRRDTRPIGHMVDLLGNEVIPFDGTAEKNERECVRRLNLSGRDAKKLFYHIDRAELKDGKAVVSGWVCAKTRKKEFLPADIRLFDESGEPAGRAVHRTMRSDVAEVLKAPNDFPCWGFDFSWSVRTDKRYTLCFSAGRCQQEILLNEIWERN